ncbi:MAG: acetyl-CoA carboxylase biotin carboxyl carrier protein subunit [Lewinellaceae bacterium]|nr:acetyl-CoA carboxylase biotin carboxyl carrier protein subunit [Lewinellaceae bacterium]
MASDQDAIYRVRIAGAEPVMINPEVLSHLDVIATEDGRYHLLWEGKSIHFEMLSLDLEAKRMVIRAEGQQFQLEVSDALQLMIERLGLQRHRSNALEQLRAPMPGLVLKFLVQPGDHIQPGDPVVILEAMKMENVIKSTGHGTVDQLRVSEGQPVEKEEVLMSFR